MENEIAKIKVMYEAVNKILEFTKGINSAEELTSDILVWDAVKMNLVVIYETDLKIAEEVKKKYNSVEWHQIKENKPILESQYLGFDGIEIWKAIEGKMPQFKKQLEEIVSLYTK